MEAGVDSENGNLDNPSAFAWSSVALKLMSYLSILWPIGT